MSSAPSSAVLPYSHAALANIINVLDIEDLPRLSANEVAVLIQQGDLVIKTRPPSRLYDITRRLEGFALEYLGDRAFERAGKFRDTRKVLEHIADADLEALPASIRDQLISWREFSPLRSVLRQIRENADCLLKSVPKRGALPKEARLVFVNGLADLYEEATGRKASKVGKEPGPFERFVRAAIEPVDRYALTGIGHVIDTVVDRRRKQTRPRQP